MAAHMLSFEAQSAAYSWRGAGCLTLAAIIAATGVLGTPYIARQYWSAYLAFWDADQHPVLFFMLHGVIWPNIIFWLGNCVLMLIYKVQPAWLEQFRLSSVWPWQGDEKVCVGVCLISHNVMANVSTQRQAKWQELMKKTILQVLFNQLVLALPLGYFTYDAAVHMGYTHSLEKFPSLYTVVLQVIAFMVIEDTLFYWSHRTLHHPRIYKYVHKQHHEYQDAVIGISAEYAHWLEFIIGNAIPFTAGPVLFGAHAIVWVVWALVRIGETLDSHSGYDLPWSPYRLIPFSGSSGHHDFHHSHVVGNYGTFFLWWDALCGTDAAYRKFLGKYGHVTDARFLQHRDQITHKRLGKQE